MIDLHTHTLLSDGVLLPSELVRRAEAAGYKVIGIADHADSSNIDFIISGLVKVSVVLNKYWGSITVIPAIELTHIPLEQFQELTDYARKNGIKIVIGHGQTVSEPVLEGTNKAAIEAGVDILAHPGMISIEDAKFAKKRGVFLELTTRPTHEAANGHVVQTATEAGADLIINSDAHRPQDLNTVEKVEELCLKSGIQAAQFKGILENSQRLVKRVLK